MVSVPKALGVDTDVLGVGTVAVGTDTRIPEALGVDTDGLSVGTVAVSTDTGIRGV